MNFALAFLSDYVVVREEKRKERRGGDKGELLPLLSVWCLAIWGRPVNEGVVHFFCVKRLLCGRNDRARRALGRKREKSLSKVADSGGCLAWADMCQV